MAYTDLPKEGYVRPAQVAFALGVSRGTVYNWIASGKLPEPQRDGKRLTRWSVHDIRPLLPQPPA